jgi:hypothetical protein
VVSGADPIWFVLRWKADSTYYIGERDGLPRWGTKDQAKRLTASQAHALAQRDQWRGQIDAEYA